MKYYKLTENVFVKSDGKNTLEINSATGYIVVVTDSFLDYMHKNYIRLEDISQQEFDEQHIKAANLINSLFD